MEKIIASITKEINGKIYEVYPYSKTTAISDKDNNNLQNILDNKVDKEVGKELISKEEVERLSNITEYDDSNIINTLNNKVDKVDGKDLSSNDFTDDLKSKIATSYSKEELDSKFSTKANASSLANKVDKVDGKGLSSNDFTDDLKTNYDSSYENTHSHSNKSTIDKLSESNDGKLQYNGVTIDGSGSTISVDSELSSSSENPVQNKVIYQSLTNKVDKLSGKDLSTNDFTDDLKDKIETLYSKDELDSKFSTKANASSLANKVDKVVGKDLISITEIDRLMGVTNYDDTDINNALSNKVDKLVGKDLSSNDFTDELKDKIDLIDVSSDGTKYLSNDGTYKIVSSGSNVTVDAELSTTSENPVQNKSVTSSIYDIKDSVSDLSEFILFNGKASELRISKPIVCVVADDGLKTTEGQTMTAWLEEQGISECFAIITSNVGASGAYTLDELNALKNKGHEILCHSRTVSSLSQMLQQKVDIMN